MKWIHVDERLPRVSEEVFVYDPGGFYEVIGSYGETYAIGYYANCDEEKDDRPLCFRARDSAYHYLCPTHWALPDPPGASGKAQPMNEHSEMSDADLAGALREQAQRLSGLLTEALERGLHVEIDISKLDARNFDDPAQRHLHVMHVTVERRERL